MENQKCVLCGVNQEVAHFKFPKNKFKDWEDFCKKINPTIQVRLTSKLCCLHFGGNSFRSLYHRHILNKNAVPTLSNENNQTRKCIHNIVPNKPKLVTEKRSYGWHLGLKYCLLCRSKRSGVAFFSFPKDNKIRQQWMEFCEVDDTRIKIGSTLCQYHFTDNDFRLSNCGRVYLKSGAIPSIRSINTEVDRSQIIADRPTDCNENSENLGDMPRNADLIQFRFPNNKAMRLFLMMKCGFSSSFLDATHEISISHFDSDDIGLDNGGKRIVKDGALPWKYLSEMMPNSSDNISHSSIINNSKEWTAIPSTLKSNGTEMSTPVRPMRKRKAYVGDMTPSDFKTPRCTRRNLTFIKNKFKDVSVKMKKLQDQNRKANQRVKKVLETVKTLKRKDPISDVAITVHQGFLLKTF